MPGRLPLCWEKMHEHTAFPPKSSKMLYGPKCKELKEQRLLEALHQFL